MTILYSQNVQDRGGSTIKISVFTDDIIPAEEPTTDSLVLKSSLDGARALNRRVAECSREFDQILIAYTRSHLNFQRQISSDQNGNGVENKHVDGFIKGFNRILDVEDYLPQEVDITLPEPGKLVVKGEKAFHEFCEEFELPPDVDDEEISVVKNSKGKLVVQAPYL